MTYPSVHKMPVSSYWIPARLLQNIDYWQKKALWKIILTFIDDFLSLNVKVYIAMLPVMNWARCSHFKLQKEWSPLIRFMKCGYPENIVSLKKVKSVVKFLNLIHWSVKQVEAVWQLTLIQPSMYIWI